MPNPASSHTGYMAINHWKQSMGDKAWSFMDGPHENIIRSGTRFVGLRLRIKFVVRIFELRELEKLSFIVRSESCLSNQSLIVSLPHASPPSVPSSSGTFTSSSNTLRANHSAAQLLSVISVRCKASNRKLETPLRLFDRSDGAAAAGSRPAFHNTSGLFRTLQRVDIAADADAGARFAHTAARQPTLRLCPENKDQT
jgi:hypothetical protein